MKDGQTQFLDEYVHIWLDIQLDLGQSDLNRLKRDCFHFLYHLAHSCVRHLLLHLLQIGHRVGARQQDVQTAVTCQRKPCHLLANVQMLPYSNGFQSGALSDNKLTVLSVVGDKHINGWTSTLYFTTGLRQDFLQD